MSCSDAELACDESCVKALGDDRRLDYGRALVDMLDSRQRACMDVQVTTTMSVSKRAVQERVKRIAKAPKTRIAADRGRRAGVGGRNLYIYRSYRQELSD